jgi:hypothetical protein
MTTGTHLGDWMGIPATGVKAQGQHLDVWEVEGNNVKRVTVYDDGVQSTHLLT